MVGRRSRLGAGTRDDTKVEKTTEVCPPLELPEKCRWSILMEQSSQVLLNSRRMHVQWTC